MHACGDDWTAGNTGTDTILLSGYVCQGGWIPNSEAAVNMGRQHWSLCSLFNLVFRLCFVVYKADTHLVEKKRVILLISWKAKDAFASLSKVPNTLNDVENWFINKLYLYEPKWVRYRLITNGNRMNGIWRAHRNMRPKWEAHEP